MITRTKTKSKAGDVAKAGTVQVTITVTAKQYRDAVKCAAFETSGDVAKWLESWLDANIDGTLGVIMEAATEKEAAK